MEPVKWEIKMFTILNFCDLWSQKTEGVNNTLY